MHFGLSEEHEQLLHIARRFLAEVPSVRQRVERTEGHIYNHDTWGRISDELGWPAMSAPEDMEGWGFGILELALVMEEQGRTLTPSPVFATAALGLQSLLGVATEQHAQDLTSWMASGCRGTVALLESGVGARRRADAPHTPAMEPPQLHPGPGGIQVLQGTVRRVLDGDSATLFLVETPDGLVAVEPTSSGVRVESSTALDLTRPMATLHFEGVPITADRVFRQHDPDAFRTRARILLAAEQTGVAQGALDLTVAYAKVREQYGRPIGAFQAVQHQLADMLVAIECARSATWYAAAALDEGQADATEAAMTALCTASEAATLATGQAIQLHGGIGFTWEHDAHLYFKRAAANRHLLGSPDQLRAALATQLLGPVQSAGGTP